MAYYEYVDMNSLQSEDAVVLENICLLLNEKWHYRKVEETKKMVEMFEDSEEVIARFMSIKEIDVTNRKTLTFLTLTEDEKRLGMIEDPERWIVEIDKQEKGSLSFFGSNDNSGEMLKSLAKFFLKIAVYRFCTVHFPKLIRQDKTIDKKRVKTLQKELEHWEFCFWIDSSVSDRERLISNYDAQLYGFLDMRTRIVRSWIKEAYKDSKDKAYYENAKKLRLRYMEENRTAKEDDSSDRKSIEIESMRSLLDIMERHLSNNLTPQDITDLKENIQNWEKGIEKLSGMINKLSDFDLKEGVLVKDDFFEPEEKSSCIIDKSNGDNIQVNSREELTGEIREQISEFVENMMECVNDFLKKINSYESEEELYENLELSCPDACDYESSSYEYPSKAKAKVACKEQVESLVNDLMENFEDEKEHIISYTADYYKGLEDAFAEFVNEFSESYDEYMSLECVGSAAEYVSSQKSILFGKDILYEKVKEEDLKIGFAALVKERFDNQIKKCVDAKKYFSLCKYDEEDGDYCYIMDDACNAIFEDVEGLLTTEIEAFPEKVFQVYISAMDSYCDMLKNRLAEL